MGRPSRTLALPGLIPVVDARNIRIRGEKVKTLEGGIPYRDAAVCNSYVQEGEVRLDNCAYYEGIEGVTPGQASGPGHFLIFSIIAILYDEHAS